MYEVETCVRDAMDISDRNTRTDVDINIEYCGACNYSKKCLDLAKIVKSIVPDAKVTCTQGRRGSFEVVVNDKLIYSKLSHLAFPDFGEVAEIAKQVSQGSPVRSVKAQQTITECALS